MKIIIIDGYHDSDKGGAGILNGLLSTLYKIEEEEKISLEIFLVYRYSEDDERYKTSYRHTFKAFPQISVGGSPLSSVQNGRIKIIKEFVLSILVLLVPNLATNRSIKEIRNADLIISKGGHFYQNHNSRNTSFIKELIGVYRQFYTLMLCLRLNKKIALFSHSLGPFEGKISRIIAKFVFSKLRYLSTREKISIKILNEIGLETNNIKVTPDLAFAMKTLDNTDTINLLKKLRLRRKRYAVITARKWDFPLISQERGSLYNNYIISLAGISDYLIKHKIVNKVLLVVHNDGKHSTYEDDTEPMNMIYNSVKQKDHVAVLKKDYSSSELSSLYGMSRLMIGTRLHSVIFALVLGCPSIAISYTHKGIGIMSGMGLDKYVVDIDTISTVGLKSKVNLLIKNEMRLSKNIRHEVKVKQIELFKEIKHVVTSV